MRYHPLRWIAFSVFVLSSTLNYVDRFLLNQLGPLIIADLGINKITFGWVLSASSIAYAAASLFAGWMLDRLGVNRAISVAVGWWSLSGMGTALVKSTPGLFFCRAALAAGESAGVPSVGKVNGLYLKPSEHALGAAVNQIGLSIGLALAPIWTAMAMTHSWRRPFVVTGILSLLWIPLWLFVNRFIRPREGTVAQPLSGEVASFSLLRHPDLLRVVAANVLWMGGYSLWSNWMTFYLMGVYGVDLRTANNYSWIPPLVSNLGGFFGGWLSLHWIRRNLAPVRARSRAVWVSAIACMVALLLPIAPDIKWATVLISANFFFLLAGSVNIYALPIDLFGAAHAGFAIAALTCAYGILQTVISPLIGYFAERKLYNGAVWMTVAPLLLSGFVLNGLHQSQSEDNLGREL
jgi:ACS family hexuronate transporter-like MFS transporter